MGGLMILFFSFFELVFEIELLVLEYFILI